MIKRTAQRLGYVPRAELDAVKDQLRGVRQRIDQLTHLLERETTASKQLKTEVAQLQKQRRDEAEHYEARLAHLTAKHQEQLRERDARIEAVLHEGRMMEERVEAAMKDAELARDYLSAIEVKLDVLEGAANVLDERTRVIHRHRELTTAAAAAADTRTGQ